MRRALVVALMLLPAAAHAERLSLAAAQKEAREKSPGAAAIAEEKFSADASARAMRRTFSDDPVVRFSARPASTGGGTASAGVEWALPPWGIASRFAAATAELERARILHDGGLLALDEEVAGAVAELAAAHAREARAERVAALSALALDGAKRAEAVGRGSPLETDGAALDAADAAALVADAQAAEAAARAALGRLLGRPSSTELSVEDPAESPAIPAAGSLDAIVADDPRVRAAAADLVAARSARASERLSTLPRPTISLEIARTSNDIPAGAFSGIGGAPGLEAKWNETETALGLSFPIPSFDAHRRERADASGRARRADAALSLATADARADAERSWSQLVASAKALEALSAVPSIVDRDFGLLDKAVRAGSLDSVARAVAVRRLLDSGTRYDEAVLSLRRARASWARLSRQDLSE